MKNNFNIVKWNVYTKTHTCRFVIFPPLFFSYPSYETGKLSAVFILIVALVFSLPSLSIFFNVLIKFVSVKDSMFRFLI